MPWRGTGGRFRAMPEEVRTQDPALAARRDQVAPETGARYV